jgi:hypothetical protein
VRRFGWSTLFLFLAGSCRTPPRDDYKGGHLEAQWSGPARGRISGPAAAEWCSSRRRLEIRTVQGDTGIALVIYPAETIVAGQYRVVDPVKAESLPPAAAIALRWLTQTMVQGFQGDSGVIALERSPAGLLSGRIRVGARSVVDAQKVSVTGTFQDLTVRPQPRGCVEPAKPPATHAEPGDTGVH